MPSTRVVLAIILGWGPTGHIKAASMILVKALALDLKRGEIETEIFVEHLPKNRFFQLHA